MFPLGLQVMTKLVLLVEDTADNCHIYRTILEFSGFEVHEARDGEEGLRLARAMGPGVIFMDISIPKIDGLAVTRMLKADPATARIPIVALTAHALPEDRTRALKAGFDAYLVKPVRPRDVTAEAARWLGMSSPVQASAPGVRQAAAR